MKPTEQERKVKENEVPAAALATLKKLAGSATITEFAEEIEHGGKFYEGSWKAADGQVDALVSEVMSMAPLYDFVAPDGPADDVRHACERLSSVAGIAIEPGETFWIRWTDFDIAGSDDGLAIDDFTLGAGREWPQPAASGHGSAAASWHPGADHAAYPARSARRHSGAAQRSTGCR